ncbi:MAG: hypothetical protein AB8G05_12930 [Oligoflexales bacterium]
MKFENIMHLYNEETLVPAFHSLDGKKAVGWCHKGEIRARLD